ncbi:hypothetical protein SISNIDRAFT_478354 [Sistotremastrum niveocremeum HHB9708]|uniref:Pre-mRNA-splicing factor CWC26 n=1 Tax=Sistotremastrum niveocremeum HHB9708 TaxID=1314777 RepID=A0A164V8F9_9AGAM|nr:hypothetical protein SISNIDRAFT_478354 [Sistotremastrum niveocremeum HHB9708]
MQSYLASKYMSGPKADAILAKTGHKKKKRKNEDGANSFAPAIQEDDLGFGTEPTNDQTVDDSTEAVVASDRSFKKRKTDGSSEWATIWPGEGPKQRSASPAEEDKPLVVDQQEETPFKGGLLTSSQLKRRLPGAQSVKPTEASEQEQETVYRDASGRKIDTKAERAEAARKKRENEEKEAQKMQWGKGLVQREDEEKRRRELELEKTRDIARYADDADLNAHMKAEERWNDPAAAFLTKNRSKGPRKPMYNGPPPPPNRFGIRPGYRWDGVDRGNGFEKKLFQKGNDRQRRGLEAYQWSVDEM